MMNNPTPLKDGQAAIKAAMDVMDTEHAYQRVLKAAEAQHAAMSSSLLPPVYMRSYRAGVPPQMYLKQLGDTCQSLLSTHTLSTQEIAYANEVIKLSDLYEAAATARTTAKATGLSGAFLGVPMKTAAAIYHLDQAGLDVMKARFAKDMEAAITVKGFVVADDVLHLRDFANLVNSGNASILDINTIVSPVHVVPPKAPHIPTPKASSALEGDAKKWIIGGAIAAVVTVGAWMLAEQNKRNQAEERVR